MSKFAGGKAWRGLLLCIALLCGAGICESASQPVGQAQGYLSAGTERNAAVAQAAGEFRVVAANLLWAKVVDHYHHQFMAEGKPFDQNVSLLPLLQTIIILDPHFTEAYELMGGTILPRTGREAQGKAVLTQGIKNNPDDWEMYREMALLYAWNDHQPQAALPFAQQGLTEAARVTDDDGFARQLMTRLCDTVHRQVQDGDRAGTEHWERVSNLINAHSKAQTHLRPAPALAASAPQSRPSGSG